MLTIAATAAAMSFVYKSIRRANKKPTKYKFSITFKELIFDFVGKDESYSPERISIAIMRGQKRYESKVRKTETSFTNKRRFLVVWPDAAADHIDIVSTLFQNYENKDFEDKEWTMIVEDVLSDNRTRPLAAISLNLRLFFSRSSPVEARFRLRPLRPELKSCTLFISLSWSSTIDGTVSQTLPRASESAFVRTTENYVVENQENPKISASYCSEDVKNIVVENNMPNLQNEVIMTEVIEEVEKIKEHNGEVEQVDSKAQRLDFRVQRVDSKGQREDSYKKLKIRNVEICPRDETDKSANDNVRNNHRVSKMFELSEQERSVILELERFKNARESCQKTSISEALSPVSPIEPPPLHEINGVNSAFVKNVVPFMEREMNNEVEKINERIGEVQPMSFKVQPMDSKVQPMDSNVQRVGSYGEQKIRNFDINSTPVKKIMSNLEREMNVTNSEITIELEKISERIGEVERMDSYTEQKIRNVEAGSDEEHNLIEQHLKYLTERDALVRRQDYLNILSDLKETEEKIEIVQKQLNQAGSNDGRFKTGRLMDELKELIDKKDNLSHVLMDKEAEEEEENERGRKLVEQSQHFLRGNMEPLSASKRIFNWFSPRN